MPGLTPDDAHDPSLVSPPWSRLLSEIELQVANAPISKAPDKVKATLAIAHARLLTALNSGAGGQQTVRELLTATAQLLADGADVQMAGTPRSEDRRAQIVERLRQHLRSYEGGVLAGELTYAVSPHEAEEPTARVRQAAARLSGDASSHGAASSLQVGSAGLASLLVRAAANASASGRADQAPEARSTALDRDLRALLADLAARASSTERLVGEPGDVVAHHLAAGLRVRMPHRTLECLADRASTTGAELLKSAEDAWLRLATCEYVAVKALDPQLETLAYDERFDSLDTAIIEGTANVLCGGRLLSRPDSFQHGKAWAHQAISLTYALEAYVAGLRGNAASFVQAERIALTRLVRAIAAIHLLRVRHRSHAPSNGHPKRRG